VFETVRSRFDRWRAFWTLRSITRSDNSSFSAYFLEQIDLSRMAFVSGNREEAFDIWRKMNLQFPDLTMVSDRAFNLMLDLGCYDEADAMMREGQKRYPDSAQFTRGSAQVAHRRQNHQEALIRCEILRKKFPRVAEGYAIAASCLTDLGRHDEAELMIGRGVLKLPDNFELHVQHARNATQRRDWSEALGRWDAVRGQFELQFLGPLGAAQCLRELGRYADAETILDKYCQRFPGVDWLFAEQAELATAQGDFETAVLRWKALLRRSPGFAIGYPKSAAALRKTGQELEADELLGTAVTRVRSDLAVHLEYARSAHRRGDWTAAIVRWALVRDRFPTCIEGRDLEADALAAMELQKSPRD
jgi:tetratricopeptide (TPR) repeat protein